MTEISRQSKAEGNKQLVAAFYNALAKGDVKMLRALGRPDYIQHNPAFETGLDGLVKAIDARPPRAAGAAPAAPLQFVRIIADDEFVVTIRKMQPPDETHPPNAVRANVDVFRVQDGKVAEHWDYQETFPRGSEPSKNSNGPF